MLNGYSGGMKSSRKYNNIYVAINAFWEELDFNLPSSGNDKMWYKAIDTSSKSGFYSFGSEERVETSVITVAARSIVVLIDK